MLLGLLVVYFGCVQASFVGCHQDHGASSCTIRSPIRSDASLTTNPSPSSKVRIDLSREGGGEARPAQPPRGSFAVKSQTFYPVLH